MFKVTRIAFIIPLLLFLNLSAQDSSSDTISIGESEEIVVPESSDSSKEVVFTTAPEGDIAALFYETKADKEKKITLLNDELDKKRKVMIIGNVVLATSLILEYGVILPASLDIDPDDPDLTDQVALLSPKFLGFMMKTAGSTMTTMRTSEAIDSYVSATGDGAPKNLSWKLYWASWGVKLLSTLISGVGTAATYIPEMEDYVDEIYAASFGVAVASDCIKVANGIYSMLLIKKMRGKAVAIPVNVSPTVGSKGEPGLSMTIKF